MTHQDCHALWDAADMGCGELLMLLRDRLNAMQPGQILKLIATDPGAPEDIPSWCRLTRHKLIDAKHPEYIIERRN
jgi:tRNA 2-thiouridine synthesizing protein A